MAVRSLSLTIFLAVLLATPLQACFGPKLFVGVGSGGQAEVLYALVTLYVKEKTGVESTRVELVEGEGPLALIARNTADLVFVPPDVAIDEAVFDLPGVTLLASGPRPHNDLQFTTVLPAVRKLNRLLQPAQVEALARQVEAGESAMAVVRKFLMENRWI